MQITLESKYNPGDIVLWNSPYCGERVTIVDVEYINSEFVYSVEEYKFKLSEYEIGGTYERS
jgi:N-methylhydantoinase B/oxoprolinase/acetone carboxylase alpha subunit